jgi:hypothetical protein
MKLFEKIGLVLLANVLITAEIEGQGILHNYGNTVVEGDSIILELSDFRDSVYWEKSYDQINWEIIQGTSGSNFGFIGNECISYRGAVLEGNCDPAYSNIGYINLIEVLENTILIDRYGPPTISNSIDLANGVYKFNFEFPDQIPENSYLVSMIDKGYLRKIISVSTSPGSTTFITSSAALSEIISEGTLCDSIKLYLEDSPALNPGEIAIPLVQEDLKSTGMTLNESSSIDLDGLSLFNGNIDGNLFQVKIIEGEFAFEPSVTRTLSIQPESPKLQDFSVIIEGNLFFSCDMEITANAPVASFSHEEEIGTYVYGPIPFGLAPMYIEMKFVLGVESSMSSPGVVQSGFEEASSVKLGATYNAAHSPNWSLVDDVSHEYNDHAIVWSHDGNVSNKVYLNISFDTRIADWNGPQLEIQTYSSLDAILEEIYSDWNWELSAGMNRQVNIESEFLSSAISDYYEAIPESRTIITSENGRLPVPELTTVAVTNILVTTATSGGSIINEGGSPVIEKGVCWSTIAEPTISDSRSIDGSGSESFVSEISGLSALTKYYVRAYAINASGVGYGNQLDFTTQDMVPPPPPPPPPPPQVDDPPTVVTNSITDITSTSAIGGGNVTDDGGATVTARGVCWSTSASPNLTDAHSSDGTGSGSFISNIINLSPGTDYYVRAFATNSVGTSYGNEVQFSSAGQSQSCEDSYEHTEYWDPSTTAFPSALSTSSYSRSINGTVHEAGDWDHYQVSIQSNGTIALTLSNVPDGFDLQLYDFDGDLVGSSYTTGNEYINESISASGNYIIIVGSSQNDYSCTEYTLSLNWTPDAVPPPPPPPPPPVGCEDEYEHTEYWDPSTTAFPTVLSTSSYSRSINGTVHEAGDWDHYQVSIQSNGTIALTLSNVPDGFDLQLYDFDGDLVGSSYTTGNEYINESISASGNYIIIVGSSQNDYSCTEYTLSLNWTPDDTPPPPPPPPPPGGTNPPTVLTTDITDIGFTRATGGGDVTDDGGATITARGVCWSTSANPDLSDSFTTDGTGTGTFVSELSSLSDGTTYYVRAYASNSAGTGYGEEVNFITLDYDDYPPPPPPPPIPTK